MREIKFRGKCIKTGKWVYGGYHKHIKRQINPIGDELKDDDIAHLIIQSGFADWNMPKPLQAIKVDSETVGQYTGLKDKNGTDIYEGDIVMCWGGEFCQGYWEFNDTIKVDSLTNPQTMSILSESENTEIIGNIFENPELLEGEPNG